ncbi:hypothetical protein F511_42641 [Dorcoceras hygrometricum]|uniref:Uncharacterized protein n=1 Tax=Dorcoceras hygrometricum TaxID=472368 RepID=A0A2Z7CKU0_9LAMI|nr:hypothetical protein F511_42641 [Dorcoceras hygrometricum]
MASLTVCELPNSCASCVRCGSRLRSWFGPGEPAGPGGGPAGGPPAMGGRSRRAYGWKLACRVCVCSVRVVGFVLHGPAGSAGLPPPCAAAASPEFVPAKLDEENPSAQISSRLLVQGDEGVSYPVVDRIGVIYHRKGQSSDTAIGRRSCARLARWPRKGGRRWRRCTHVRACRAPRPRATAARMVGRYVRPRGRTSGTWRRLTRGRAALHQCRALMALAGRPTARLMGGVMRTGCATSRPLVADWLGAAARCCCAPTCDDGRHDVCHCCSGDTLVGDDG